MDRNESTPNSRTQEMLRRRKARNRKTAQTSRQREKLKIEILKGKIQQLSSEANVLRTEMATTWQFEGPFSQTIIQHTCNLARAVSDPSVPENDIKRILDEIERDLNAEGTARIESLKANFRAMLEVMVPPHLRYFLWRSTQSSPPLLIPELESLLHLTPEQHQVIQACEAAVLQLQTQFSSGFEDLKTIIAHIAHQARHLTALMGTLRDILSQRQAGLFLLWLGKYYCNLDPEAVLSHGFNTAMMLRDQ